MGTDLANPAAYGRQLKENAILSATPEQLIVHLYDGALRALRAAAAALKEGRIEPAHHALRRRTGDPLPRLDRQRSGKPRAGQAPPRPLRLLAAPPQRGAPRGRPGEGPGRREGAGRAAGGLEPGRGKVSDGQPLDRYRQLVALLEDQLALAEAGNLAALAALEATWQRLAKALPEDPPPEAEALLRRAAALLTETGKRLGELQRRLEGEVRQSRTRRLVNGLYRRVEQTRGRRVDRRA